ncbi:hypothetical protein [Streptomyces capitiformicae]|uniref:hypothetical protein n=1 Tax=Streptomyces capitiformicae TaxID=2014920 RepID=UPI0016737DC9|nr:hypothetical protein [Streptomyces capitiformicae]
MITRLIPQTPARPERSVVARGTGNARAENGGTANSGCQSPPRDVADREAAHSAHASDTGDPIATAPYAIANSGTWTTIVQAPGETALRVRKRTLLIGTALAVLTIVAFPVKFYCSRRATPGGAVNAVDSLAQLVDGTQPAVLTGRFLESAREFQSGSWIPQGLDPPRTGSPKDWIPQGAVCIVKVLVTGLA